MEEARAKARHHSREVNRAHILAALDRQVPWAQIMEVLGVERTVGWLKRHALANFCPDTFEQLQYVPWGKLKSTQRRSAGIASCWQQVELF